MSGEQRSGKYVCTACVSLPPQDLLTANPWIHTWTHFFPKLFKQAVWWTGALAACAKMWREQKHGENLQWRIWMGIQEMWGYAIMFTNTKEHLEQWQVGKTLSLHLRRPVRLSDQVDLQEQPWRYGRWWSQFIRKKSSPLPHQYYTGTWCDVKDSIIILDASIAERKGIAFSERLGVLIPVSWVILI